MISGSNASSINHLVANEQLPAVNETVQSTDAIDLDEVVFSETGPKGRSLSNVTLQSTGT